METQNSQNQNQNTNPQQNPQGQNLQNPNPNPNQNPQQKQNPNQQSGAENKPKRAFRIGIVANGLNDEDILYYNEQLKEINKLYREKIRIVVLGYKRENDRLNMLEGVIFEYVKPVSVVHYFKQLASMQIDLLFIPLINNLHNATSEDYEKYLEAGVLKIPIIAPDIYPYNKLIQNENNGFIFGNRDSFIKYLQDLLHNKLSMIRPCALRAHDDVVKNFNYSVDNINVLSSAFM